MRAFLYSSTGHGTEVEEVNLWQTTCNTEAIIQVAFGIETSMKSRHGNPHATTVILICKHALSLITFGMEVE